MTTATKGLCQCGCGQATRIAPCNNWSPGAIKGEPLRYLKGHHTRQGYLFDRYKVTAADCWEWTGQIDPQGYGRAWNGERMVGAHRLFYEHHVGLIPPGRELHHRCTNRPCVNPAHLEVVTPKEHGRYSPAAQKTHCVKGHAFDEANTYFASNGTRRCRRCGLAANAEWQRSQSMQKNRELLEFVDNPCNEDRWGDAKAIADRAGVQRRGFSNRLEQLERAGLIESKGVGAAPSMRSDKPPRRWRVKR